MRNERILQNYLLCQGGNDGKGFFMNIDQRPGISNGLLTSLVGAFLGISTSLPSAFSLVG